MLIIKMISFQEDFETYLKQETVEHNWFLLFLQMVLFLMYFVKLHLMNKLLDMGSDQWTV